MSQKNFTNATGNWSVRDDGNISYLGGAVGVQELDIESGRLTAYADPIPEYVYGDEPNRAFLWRNPVTGTILGFDNSTDTIARSTDNGATWHYVDSPLEMYGPYVKVKGEYEPGADFIGTNTDGSMILFGPGEGNMFSTDDGLTWSLWSGGPKGVLEGTQKILYNEETDTWRVLGSVNTTSALMMEFQGSDPNVYLRNSFNSNWAPYSRAMIMDNGQILFNNHSWGYTQSDGSYQTSLTLLKDSSSVEDDNVFASYVFRLEDVDYGSDVGRPSFNQGKDLQGRNMGAVAYTRSNNTLGIRTTIDGQNWTDLSDQLGDLPLVAQNGMVSILWLEGRQEWLVFATKLSKGGNWNPQPGDAYVFKTSIPGDLTSLVDVTYNALVGSRVQYAVGSDLGVWIAPKLTNNTNIAIKDITETNPPNLDLYWDGEKLATEPYVDSLAINVQTDLTNCVKIEVPGFTEQSIGGFRIKLNTEIVKLGYINDYGNPANQTEMSYLSNMHVTSILTPGVDYINEFPTTISINRTKSYTQNDRDFGAFTTDWLKPNRFRDKVEIDLDPTGDFDAVNKKYVDGVIGGGGSSLWTDEGGGAISHTGTVKIIGELLAAKPDAGENAFAAGSRAGQTGQGNYAVAVGRLAGETTQGGYSVAVGVNAGNSTQGSSAVAVGNSAGYTGQGNYGVAVGVNAGQKTQGSSAIAVGYWAGNTSQGNYGVAVGDSAGIDTQGQYAVSVGRNAGHTTQGENAVAVGNAAGYTTQSTKATALGFAAGQTTQGAHAVAVGDSAGNGNQGTHAVAVGSSAGSVSQSEGGVAIGTKAGKTSQGLRGISIGESAGESNQGQYSIAIGRNAGIRNQGGSGIIISSGGYEVNRTNIGHIVLNSPAGSLNFNGVDKWTFAGGAVQATDYLDANGDSIIGAVNSVNGKTGDVNLNYSDVGAQVAGNYQPAGNYPQSTTVTTFVTLTQSQYDSLIIKNSNTIYFIQE